MADRQRSQDGESETQKVLDAMEGDDNVPGAHGDGEDRELGATGVSYERRKTSEIAPTEETGAEGDSDG